MNETIEKYKKRNKQVQAHTKIEVKMILDNTKNVPII